MGIVYCWLVLLLIESGGLLVEVGGLYVVDLLFGMVVRMVLYVEVVLVLVIWVIDVLEVKVVIGVIMYLVVVSCIGFVVLGID